jgi:hypothetical protein
MNKNLRITEDDIDKAFNSLNESDNNDIININGIPFKNVHMPLDEYAIKIGAVSYNETEISKF